MASIATRRLSKELRDLHTNGCPVGIELLEADDKWVMGIEVLGDTPYAGERFALQFRFEPQYPITSPIVTFLPAYRPPSTLPSTSKFSPDQVYGVPVHPHVYSNGHICASILGTEWSPVLTVATVCITLQSMLASCKRKERPVDNDRYVRSAPDNPKQTRFHYDDDTV